MGDRNWLRVVWESKKQDIIKMVLSEKYKLSTKGNILIDWDKNFFK